MLSKEIDDLIDEFILLDNNEKFKRKYTCYFSNNTSVNHWFKKYEDEILSSDDKRCQVVKKQYQQYIDNKNKQKRNYSNSFQMMFFSENIFLKEFVQINDDCKYEPDCDIYLSNGVNAYDFFRKILEKVMYYNDPKYKEIKDDYAMHKLKKQKLNYKKNLLMFCKSKGFGKFDIDSHVKLQSGVDAGIWFDEFKEFILKRKGPIETRISDQYENFLIYYDIAKEFLEEENLEKFDFDSNVRFISCALMNFWWECNEEKIRYSDLNIDKLIMSQYDTYIKGKKL